MGAREGSRVGGILEAVPPPPFGSQPWELGLMQFQGEAIRQEMGPLTLSHLRPKSFQEFQMPSHRVPGYREKGEFQTFTTLSC